MKSSGAGGFESKARRTLAENLEEALALIRFVSGFTGGART
jgi:hypothetical protein